MWKQRVLNATSTTIDVGQPKVLAYQRPYYLNIWSLYVLYDAILSHQKDSFGLKFACEKPVHYYNAGNHPNGNLRTSLNENHIFPFYHILPILGWPFWLRSVRNAEVVVEEWLTACSKEITIEWIYMRLVSVWGCTIMYWREDVSVLTTIDSDEFLFNVSLIRD